jgi:hypothetical protein
MNQVLLDAQAKVHSVKSNAIRAARAVITKELGVKAPLSMVHFNVVKVDTEEHDGWGWVLIDQEQAAPISAVHTGGAANHFELNTAGKDAVSKAREAEAADAPQPDAAAAKARRSAAVSDALDDPRPSDTVPTAATNLPRPSADAAKDDKMPPWGRAGKAVNLQPLAKIYPHRKDSKYGVLSVLMNRPQGMTLGEAYDAMTAPGRDWRRVVIRPALVHKINRVSGYGVRQEDWNGEDFARTGRVYEATRLGMVQGEDGSWSRGPEYDPAATLPVYFLVVPATAKQPE